MAKVKVYYYNFLGLKKKVEEVKLEDDPTVSIDKDVSFQQMSLSRPLMKVTTIFISFSVDFSLSNSMQKY